jgi:hypothetical protein
VISFLIKSLASFETLTQASSSKLNFPFSTLSMIY